MRRRAAARASSVIVAPASMRAISSCRASWAQRLDARGHALALVGGGLGDAQMSARARRDLRRMGHGQHLHARGEPREALADGVGDRAADARVDLVEDQRRRRAAIGEHDFQRQHEAREFAARGDLHQRPRPRARIGLHPEFDAVDALGPAADGSLVDLRREARVSSFSGASSPFTALSSVCGRLRARLATERAAAACEAASALRAPPSQRASCASPASSAARSAANRSASAGSSSTGTSILARRRRAARTAAPRCVRARADRIGVAQRLLERLRRGVERDQRRVERFDRRLDQRGACGARRSSRRSDAAAPAPANGRRATMSLRVAQFAGDLLGLHHACAAVGERVLLARLAARACVSSVMGVARDNRPPRARSRCVRASLGSVARRLAQRSHRPRARPRPRASSPPKASSRARCMAGSTSARSSCWPWISTSAAPMARRACTLTGWSLTKARVRPSAICTRRRIRSPSMSMSLPRGGAAAGCRRGRSKTAVTWPCVCAGAHERAVAARAERERESVEQDGFARAGLAGEHRQAAAEVEVEPIDQDDVADRRAGRAWDPCTSAPAEDQPWPVTPRTLREIQRGLALLGANAALLQQRVGVLVPVAVGEVVAEHGRGGLRLVRDAQREIGLGQAIERLLGVAGRLVLGQHVAEAVDRGRVILAARDRSARPASPCRRAGRARPGS